MERKIQRAAERLREIEDATSSQDKRIIEQNENKMYKIIHLVLFSDARIFF